MLSANRIAWGAGLLLAVVATMSSVSNATVVSTFSGSVGREGVSAHSFTIPNDAVVEVTLTGLGPQAVTKVGLARDGAQWWQIGGWAVQKRHAADCAKRSHAGERNLN